MTQTPLTAEVSINKVVIGFGSYTVVEIELSEDELYEISNTGTTEDEIAARVAARWLAEKLGA